MKFKRQVKSSELFGGHPCEEAMVESGECGSADAPGCGAPKISSFQVFGFDLKLQFRSISNYFPSIFH